jgi:hypothetical protein
MNLNALNTLRKLAKRKTYAQAQEDLFKHLRKEMWAVVDHLAVPHATSRDGTTRVWFKKQAVYLDYDVSGRVSFKNALSMHIDIRTMSGEQFMADIEKDAASHEKLGLSTRRAADRDACGCDDDDEGTQAEILFDGEMANSHMAMSKLRKLAGGAGSRIRWSNRFFKRFFAEKDLPTVDWELRSKDGTPNWISNEVVLEFINKAPKREQDGRPSTASTATGPRPRSWPSVLAQSFAMKRAASVPICTGGVTPSTLRSAPT